MKNALQFLRKNPEIHFFIFAFIVWTAFMCYENAKEGGDFSWHDLKVEANGMIFDLFVFGILVTTYNAIRARKEKTERLMEEIDDYRGWDEKEAMYRIVGAVKRLNKAGITSISLYSCFLEGANLAGANLAGANLEGAILRGADLAGADLRGADLRGADLTGASLRRADLTGADLTMADLTEAFLSGANFTRATLRWAIVGKDWFEKLKKWEVIGREEIIEKYQIGEKGKLQLK